MSNALFPKFIGLTWDIKKRPRWQTIVQAAVSGREVRIPQQVMPIWEFELVYSVLQDQALPFATAPASPSLSAIGGGSLPATTYYVKTTWVGSFGESLPSAEASIACAASQQFQCPTPASPPAGTTGWNLYVSTYSGGEVLQFGPVGIGGTVTWPNTLIGLAAGAPPPINATDFDALDGFYLQRQGAFDSFLLNDPTDNSVITANIGTGDGTNKIFQIVSPLGGFNQVQQNPVGPVAVFLNGTQQSSGYTVGALGTPNGGVVTFTTAPGAGVAVTASFSYFYRVRFKEDMIEFNEFLANLWEMKQLNLVSVKL